MAQWQRIHQRCRRRGCNPWVGKIPWRGTWQPTPVFLPGEPHGERSLVGRGPWGHTESDTTEATEHTHSEGRVGHHQVEQGTHDGGHKGSKEKWQNVYAKK